ncbi:LLM class flavin-dependent oxidoreductase [Candidatus Entotheonella palauensis]|uniref:FMN-dependent monooxygenase n=1 Tax=Candidatus Entotheonella gemina TaxID=1429439 RepID=W4MFK1_9BACT|nr:LLM class flavin-dependent oxidoreductase [Candidatus Entotheonella palauensis]ETX08955.1 MAG: FMN-dependent monooxygenase [Candidatus Entotheonella gemina]
MKIGAGLRGNTPDDWESMSTFAAEAERLGVDSIWSSETWGFDGATPLAYIAARTSRVRLGTSILQIDARTPALTAMTAMALASMTQDRFILGLGISTPQIMEGWHGVAFDRPLQRTRELLEIIRLIEARERVTYDGGIYRIPLPGAMRAMRSSASPRRVPIYLASVGPQNLRLTGEVADGWIGNCFLPETSEAFFGPLRTGAEAAGRSLADLELQVPVSLEFDDDVDAVAKRHAEGYAFSLGAMGASNRNFYVECFARQGFEDVREVHRLWLDGRREEAKDLVPVDIGLKTNLLGTAETVKDRLRAYRDVGIDELRVGLRGATINESLEQLGQLMELVREVNSETAEP